MELVSLGHKGTENEGLNWIQQAQGTVQRWLLVNILMHVRVTQKVVICFDQLRDNQILKQESARIRQSLHGYWGN